MRERECINLFVVGHCSPTVHLRSPTEDDADDKSSLYPVKVMETVSLL